MNTNYPMKPVALALLAGLLGGGAARAQGLTFSSSLPAANAIAASRQGVFQHTFTGGLLNANAAQGLRVFSAQRGGQRVGHSGTVDVGSSQLTFNQTTYASRPGETVSVSLTAGITGTDSAALTNPTVYQFMTNVGGTGRGVFGPLPGAAPSSVPTDARPVYVKLADVDNDGDLDMLTCNDGDLATTFASTVSVRLNNGAGVFTVPAGGTGTIAVGQNARCLAVGDVDNDGDLDLVTGNEYSKNVSVRLNGGAGSFDDPGGAAGTVPTTDLSVRGVALADIDADGDLDLLVAGGSNNNGGLVNVRFNNGAGLFMAPASPSAGRVFVDGQTRNLTLGDVDNDGDLDLLVACINSSTISVRLNDGAGVFSAPLTTPDVPVGQGPVAVATGDVDGDGDLDFVSANSFGSTASVRLNDGTGTFAPPAGAANGTVAVGGFPFDIVLGDLDADGDLDLLTPQGSSGATGGVVVRFNNGSGGFAPAAVPAYATAVTGESANGVALGDVDNDGDLDLVAANQFSDNVSVRLNGPGPEISVRALGGALYPSGSTYSFGTQPGGTQPLQVFYIKNLGATNNLTVSAITPAGGGMGVSSGGFPLVLQPGDSTLMGASLLVPATGTRTGTLTIANNDLDESSYLITFTVTADPPPTSVTWTGAVDTRWHLAGNWSPAVVPTATISVLIPAVPNQPVVSTATATCANLTTRAGTTLTIPVAAGHLTVVGDLESSGTITMTNGQLELKGLQNRFGNLAATGGTVALTGTNLQLIAGDNTFWNLTVAGGNTYNARQDGNTRIKRILRLGRNLDLNNATVFLLSDADGTAMVVNAGGILSGIGQVAMQRYIGGPNAGLGYRHLSAPSSFTRLAQLGASGYTPVLNPAYNTTGNSVTPFPNFFGFDESRLGAAGVPGPVGFDQGWVSPAGINDSFVPGRGYTVNMVGSATPTIFSGYPNNGPVAVGALSHSGTGPFAGYHLLGNPYPAPLDWDSVARPTGLDNAVYVFRSTGQYTGFYDSYVNGLGTLAGGEIAAMQGFFVHVSQNVPSFSFTNAARKTVYTNPTFRRDANLAGGRPTLALALRPASGGEADKTFVYFEQGATAAADAAYDAGKLPNPSGLNLASQLGADSYAINGLPLLGAQPLVLPLTVGVPATGQYELAVEQLVNFAPGTTLYLRDALLGTLTPLAAGTTHTFTLTGYTAPGRFALEFRPGGALASAAQLLEARVQVFPNPAQAGAGVTVAAPAGARVTVAAPAGARVTVLNALGQVVLPAQAVGSSATLPLPTAGLAAGLYVVQVTSRAGMVAKRLLVQ
jgi:hypothetical protein